MLLLAGKAKIDDADVSHELPPLPFLCHSKPQSDVTWSHVPNVCRREVVLDQFEDIADNGVDESAIASIVEIWPFMVLTMTPTTAPKGLVSSG